MSKILKDILFCLKQRKEVNGFIPLTREAEEMLRDKPCPKHTLAFVGDCPESKNIEGLSECETCGWLVK